MSSFLAPARARSVRLPATAPSPRLAVVPRSNTGPRRAPFVSLVVGLLAVGLVGLLVLNTSLQRGAYVVTDLRTRAAQLSLREQNLQTQVGRLQSPERLAAVAAANGMVRDDSPAFLSLRTGKVVGVPRPGQAANSVVLYGGQAVSSSSKAAIVPAGTHNSASTGLQHHTRPISRHGSATVPGKPTPRTDRRAR